MVARNPARAERRELWRRETIKRLDGAAPM